MYQQRDPVPADKMLSLMVVQAISSFYMGDYDSGVAYLLEIKEEYAKNMNFLSPQLKKLAREIIVATDLIQPSQQLPSDAPDFARTRFGVDQAQATQPLSTPTNPSMTTSNQSAAMQTEDDEVQRKLKEILERRRRERLNRQK